MKNGVFIAAFCLLAVSCSSSNSKKTTQVDLNIFLIEDFSKQIPKQILTQEEVQQDIHVLIHFLETGYGAKDYLPGNNFEELVLELNKLIGSSSEELCENLERILARTPDNHLKAAIWDGKCGNGIKLTGNVGENFVSQNKTWDTKVIKVKNKRVGLIGITRFALNNDSVWNGFEKAIKNIKLKSDVIVLDFRGNSGGDDSKGFKLSQILLGGKPPYPVLKQIKLQTSEAKLLWANLFTFYADKLKDESKDIPQAVLDMKELSRKDFESSLNTIQDSAPLIVSNAEKSNWIYLNKDMFKGPIFILTDKKCGSSCESSIDAFEAVPSVKLVGENTAGSLHFGNVGKLVLPNSKIIVQIPTQANIFENNRFTEKIGFKPDIETPTGRDALQTLLKTF